jgi:phage tail-like protein
MTQPGQQEYTLPAFRFSVEIAGITHAVFRECTGLSAQTEVHEVKEGGLNGYNRKLPGRTTFSNITLKRGLTSSKELWSWYMDVISKQDKSSCFKDVSVIHFDYEFKEVYRLNLIRAFPIKWSGPSFNASTTSEAIESFELAFEDLRRP